MKTTSTKADEVMNRYTAFDAVRLRRAAKRLRSAWSMTGGPGVKITKSDAKFHIDAGGNAPVPVIEGAWCAMTDPVVAYTGPGTLLQLDSPFTGDRNGDARHWYDYGTYKDNDGAVYTDQYKVGINPPDFLRSGPTVTTFPIYDGTGQQYPLEAQNFGQSWIEAEDLAGTNVTVYPDPTLEKAILGHPSAPSNFEWVCADADLDGDPFFSSQSVSPPRIGYIIEDKNAIVFPDTVVASAGSGNWRSYPFNCSSSAWIYGSEFFEYLIRWNITAYLPSKSSAGDADTFATYVERSGAGGNLIVPQWTGTPYQMQTQTASIEVWHAGGGVDVATAMTAINVRYAPNYATHVGAYVKVSFQFVRARRIT